MHRPTVARQIRSAISSLPLMICSWTGRRSMRIPRGSLTAIWEWITRDLLPTMARDYNARMKDLIAADKQKEARQTASAFQTKVVKSLESTLASSGAEESIRVRLGTYTAARSA